MKATHTQLARELLNELSHMRLQVIKYRKDNVFIRCPLTQNPPWYQRLCERHKRGRKRYPKHRTIIKRTNTVRALKRLIEGRQRGYVYDERINEIVKEEHEYRNG